MLWPDRPPAAAANNLHQVVHVARRKLGKAERLRLDDDVLRLCPDEPPWIDAEAFRERAVAALRAGDPEPAGEALALYVGELLPEDLYEEWTEPTRGELERLREELELVAEGEPRLLAARRDNLPAEPTAFIGREAELDEVHLLLGRSPLVTLTGPAGSGKTRLALELAARQRDRFADGVWLVELAPLSRPELVADAVAAALGVTLGRRAPASSALVQSLAGREMLLVLDNCEHLVAAAATLVDGLLRGCPQVQVLATSREALQVGGEIVWRVRSLTLPSTTAQDEVLRSEAGRLFADRATAAEPRFAVTPANAADVARICRRLDGVPLAIELAAARAGSLPPGEIARRLGESLRLLRGGRRAGESRLQTLEGALDWSYRLLDPAEAALLRRLAIFAGTFGLDAAEGVCGGRRAPRRRGRGRAAAAGRQVAGGRERGRWAPAHAPAGDDSPVRARAARARPASSSRCASATPAGTLELATTAPQHARLDLEPDNLRAALSWLLDHDPPEALRLAGWLSDWWLLRGRLVEGREWLDRAVPAHAGDDAGDRRRAAAGRPVRRRGRATWATASGWPSAASRSTASSATARAPRRRCTCWACRPGCAASTPRRRRSSRDAIAEARLAPSPGAEVNAVHTLGILAICARDLPGARARLEETLGLLGAQQDPIDPPFLVITPGFVPARPRA